MAVTVDLIKAKKGDCMLIRYGDGKLVLIDGGTLTVYKKFLAPTLAAIAGKDGGGAPQALEMVMVSHIDQDHVAGVKDLLRAVDLAAEDGEAAPYSVGRLLHNAFRKLTDAEQSTLGQIAAAESAKPAGEEMVIASAPEGEEAATLAAKLGIPINENQAGDLLLAGDEIKLPGGMKLTVLGPTKEQVEALKEKWAKEVGTQPGGLVPASVRETVANLSSLIVVAEVDGKRILLTGDALASDVYAGLEKAGLLDANGNAHFDLIKMPHHGSWETVSEPAGFLERVTADRYTISGNGEHKNPELKTLQALAAARGNAAYEISMTYEEGEGGLTATVEAFKKELAQKSPNAKLRFPAGEAASLTIELGA